MFEKGLIPTLFQFLNFCLSALGVLTEINK